MPAGRSPPRARAPDAIVAQELGEFTDRQMAQLRGVIEESLRAHVMKRGVGHEGADQECHPGSPFGHQHFDDAVDGALSFRSGSVDGGVDGTLSYDVQNTCSPKNTELRKKRRGRTVEHNSTRKVVHELRGVTDQVAGTFSGSACSSESNSMVWIAISSWRQRAHSLCFHMLHENPWFDIVMGLVIVANSASIGVETQLRMENGDEEVPHEMFWIETGFLVCFVSELIVRWLADGTKNLSSGWFWFDFLLVTNGVVYTWIVDPILASTSEDVPIISQLLTLRVLRLMRLVRALRLMEQFKELWKLCSGLLRSSRTMLSVCLLVLIAIFVFACLGIDLISTSPKLNGNEATRAIVDHHFSSLMVTALTLMQFANADSLSSVYLPLCKEEPTLIFYFLVMWLVVTVALMNLVTAVIVENAMANGREDAEECQMSLRRRCKKILPEIDQVFDELDSNHSDTLTIDELQKAAEAGTLSFPEDIKAYVDPMKLLDVFDLFDSNQSGTIERSEFYDGICHLVVSSVPLETTQILHLVRKIHDVVLDTCEDIAKLSGVRSRAVGSVRSGLDSEDEIDSRAAS